MLRLQVSLYNAYAEAHHVLRVTDQGLETGKVIVEGHLEVLGVLVTKVAHQKGFNPHFGYPH